jgi:transposase InsO family protein
MAHFIPCSSDITSEQTARLFADFVFKLHGLPASAISDRGPQFTSAFTRALCKILGIDQNLSTSFHPQTDGQTEHINAILEQYLRAYTNYQQDNWEELLTMAEFAYNNTVSSTTGLTPFFGNYGQHPKYEMTVFEDSRPDPEIVKDFREQYE